MSISSLGRVLLLAAAGLTLSLLPTRDAAAYGCDCGSVNAIVQRIVSRSEQSLKDHWTKEADKIVKAIEKHATQTSDILVRDIKTAGDRAQQIFEFEQRQRAALERQSQEYQAKQDFLRPSRSTCTTGTGMAPLPGGREVATQNRQTMIRRASAYDRNETRETGVDVATTASARVEERKRLYCSAWDQERGACPAAARQELQNADVNAASIFEKGTIGTSEELKAADDFCINLIRPLPPRPLPADAAETPTGEISTVRRLSYDARVSAARQVCHRIIGNKTQSMDLKEWAAAVEINPSVNNNAQGISIDDLIRIEIQRRYGNTTWLAETLGRDATAINLYKEIAMMQSIGLTLDWERYEMEKLIAANLAALSAASANVEFQSFGGDSPTITQVNTGGN